MNSVDAMLDELEASLRVAQEALAQAKDEMDAAVAAERERCAKIAEAEKVDASTTCEETDRAYNDACDDIATAIRDGREA